MNLEESVKNFRAGSAEIDNVKKVFIKRMNEDVISISFDKMDTEQLDFIKQMQDFADKINEKSLSEGN